MSDTEKALKTSKQHSEMWWWHGDEDGHGFGDGQGTSLSKEVADELRFEWKVANLVKNQDKNFPGKFRANAEALKGLMYLRNSETVRESGPSEIWQELCLEHALQSWRQPGLYSKCLRKPSESLSRKVNNSFPLNGIKLAL